MMKPKVTVLMPVYNGDKYLRQAVDSILSQSFTDFEFLIINDSSTDSSLKIINSYNDSRIKIINQEHRGLSAALNRGLELAQGEYIARMDADDISLPERLEKQVFFMDNHSVIGVCGTNVIMINENEQEIKRTSYPLTHEEIEIELLFNSTFAHPSVMFRTSVMKENNFKYYFDKAEDYELWVRAVKATKLANLNDHLIKYRFGVGISSNACKNDYDRCFWSILRQQLAQLPSPMTEEEVVTHHKMADSSYVPDQQFLKSMFIWLIKLKIMNQTFNLYQAQAFDKVIAKQWFAVCGRVPKKKLFSWPNFWFKSIKFIYPLSVSDKLALIKRVAVKFDFEN